MPERTLEILLSTIAVSLLSVIGAVVLFGRGRMKRFLPLLVALAAGALIGDTFLHLLPHAVEDAGGRFSPTIAWGVLGGLVGFFFIESVLHWHHHGEDVHEHTEEGIHAMGWMNLFGDMIHNLIDGMLIAGAWLVSPELGLATTIAVALHEIPQEFGDFGVLLHAGFSPARAIGFNLLSGLAAVVGAVIVILTRDAGFTQVLVPIAAGGFLYIACADLVPEIRKRARGWKLVTTVLALAAGVALMALVEFTAHHGHDHGHDAHGHEHPGDGDHGHEHPGDDDHGHSHDDDAGKKK